MVLRLSFDGFWDLTLKTIHRFLIFPADLKFAYNSPNSVVPELDKSFSFQLKAFPFRLVV